MLQVRLGQWPSFTGMEHGAPQARATTYSHGYNIIMFWKNNNKFITYRHYNLEGAMSRDMSTFSWWQKRGIQIVIFTFSKKVFQLHRPNKKISVFQVTGLKILGRAGTHIFLNYFFLEFFYAF